MGGLGIESAVSEQSGCPVLVGEKGNVQAVNHGLTSRANKRYPEVCFSGHLGLVARVTKPQGHNR